METNQIFIGRGDVSCYLQGRYANRHGLIAGATGTGKTVTLQVLAEGFSRWGVPVFLADVKGDLAGLSQKGADNAKLVERAESLGMTDYKPESFPVTFWDVFGEEGVPVRATISEMGPLLLSKLMGLNDTQNGVLQVIFKYADDNGLLLLDIKDLKSLLSYVSDNLQTLGTDYGTITKASLGVIQRELLNLEQEGAEKFFGEPAIKLSDFIQRSPDGRGMINILAADKLFLKPTLYATFLLWLLSELFETLPEQGDRDLPKLVFFFDEAHLLFKDASKVLLDKIEQVVRLIRSKGVGVYFITQSPTDIPENILGQLGNRVQHALRAFTAKDQKAVRAAAETFRAKPGVKVEDEITQLGVGEALVSVLGEGGTPTPVEKVKVAPPRSRMGVITSQERQAILSASLVATQYSQTIDRDSAYEELLKKAQSQKVDELTAKARSSTKKEPESMWETATKSAVRAASSQMGRTLGRSLLRGILGSINKSLK